LVARSVQAPAAEARFWRRRFVCVAVDAFTPLVARPVQALAAVAGLWRRRGEVVAVEAFAPLVAGFVVTPAAVVVVAPRAGGGGGGGGAVDAVDALLPLVARSIQAPSAEGWRRRGEVVAVEAFAPLVADFVVTPVAAEEVRWSGGGRISGGGPGWGRTTLVQTHSCNTCNKIAAE
jgi:hypothetical protein